MPVPDSATSDLQHVFTHGGSFVAAALAQALFALLMGARFKSLPCVFPIVEETKSAFPQEPLQGIHFPISTGWGRELSAIDR